jgi:hypothetical protein
LFLGGAAGLAAGAGFFLMDLAALGTASGLARAVFGLCFAALGEGPEAFFAGDAAVVFLGADLEADMEWCGKSGIGRYNSPIMGPDCEKPERAE